MPEFDAIVVGAGLGGLMASAGLSDSGMRVLVVEKLSFIGGKYTEIDYKGYAVTTGAWTSGGAKSHIGRFCSEIGADVEYITLRDKGGDQPARLTKIRFNDGREYHSIKRIFSNENVFYDYLRALKSVEEARKDTSTRQFIERFVKDETMLSIINAQVGTAASMNIDNFPASEYLKVMQDTIRFGPDFGFQVGGVRAYVNALTKIINRNNGRIQTGTKVAKIVVEDGKARGVELGDGTFISSDYVVHNAGARIIVKLAGEKNLPKEYVNRIRNLKPADCAAIIIGLHRPIANETPMVLTPECDRIVGIFEPTFFDPSVAPPGKHMIDIFFPLYSNNVKKEIDIAMSDLTTLYPEIEREIDMMVPIVFYKDWPGAECAQTFGQVGDERLNPISPIKNLYIVGFDTQGSGAAGDLIPFGVRGVLNHVLTDRKKLIPKYAEV